jgi:cell division septation protein DedD
MGWNLMSDQAKDCPVRSESSPPGIDREDLPLSTSYAVLQISPDASREEISAAYDYLKNTWREDRYAQVQAWRDKTKVKLAEIENAYDTILKSLLHESTDRRREPDLIRDDPSLMLPGDESQVQVDEKPPYIDRTHTKSRTSSRHLRMVLATALLIVAIVTCVLLIWLNLYRYDVIKSGNIVFPLRINRLTWATTYFNGSEWVHPPVPIVPSGRMPLKAEPAPVPPPIKALPAETAPRGIAVPPIPMSTGQGKEARRDIPGQKTSEEVAQSMSIATLASPDTQKALTAKKPFSVTKDKPLKGGKYSIQIKAFQEEAEAKSFLNDVKTRHADAHLQKAIIEGKGIWYRVLIGYYPTRDQALAYLKKQRIADTYPGSFIQKTGTR